MSDSRYTLLIVKPDAVERGLLGEILGRLERKGLRPLLGRLGRIDRELAEKEEKN
jgi:nucleoside-diphosphate kinase